jgi:Flp pilus assembly pilin Flp
MRGSFQRSNLPWDKPLRRFEAGMARGAHGLPYSSALSPSPRLSTVFRRWLRQTGGQDLIEYAMLAAFISLAAYGAMPRLGASLDSWYTVIGDFIGSDEASDDEGGEGASGSGKQSNCSATGMAKSKGKCRGG